MAIDEILNHHATEDVGLAIVVVDARERRDLAGVDAFVELAHHADALARFGGHYTVVGDALDEPVTGVLFGRKIGALVAAGVAVVLLQIVRNFVQDDVKVFGTPQRFKALRSTGCGGHEIAAAHDDAEHAAVTAGAGGVVVRMRAERAQFRKHAHGNAAGMAKAKVLLHVT